jgi:hypothetical protein
MKTVVVAYCLVFCALASSAVGCASSANTGGGDGTDANVGSGMDATGEAQAVDTGSSDSSTADVTMGTDAGTQSDTSVPSDASPPSDSGASESGPGIDSGSSDASVDCGSIPSLHVDPAGTVYCSYGADGGELECTGQQECCLGGSVGGGVYAPQQCAPFGTTCTNGGDGGSSPAIAIECAQISDCTAKGVTGATACCLQGATGPAPVAGCGYSKATEGTAVVCESDGGTGVCAAGEIALCSQNSDCATGKTCTAGKWKVFQIGFCL